MSISKLKLSIINTFNNMAKDTSGLLLCCTNDDNGEPVIHRVIATQSIVGLLCELKRAGSRKARMICYSQGIGKEYIWKSVRKSKNNPYGWRKQHIDGFNEDEVFVKTIPYSFSSATSIDMIELRYAFIKYNVFSVEDAKKALVLEFDRLEKEKNDAKVLAKKNELKNLLQNLDEDQLETLKSFIVNNEKLCKEVVDTLLLKL
jgi:hypothetical protein